jgi:citrate lyase gamma subunit
MSGKKSKKSSRLRKPAIQEDLPLPPPPGPPLPAPEIELAWWQKPATAATVALLAVLACVVAAVAQVSAHRDRALAEALENRVKTLTLRAASSQRALRIAPNPRSWSAEPDATIAWPEPPELLDLYLPIGYAQFPTFAVTIDKVDQGRMMILQRVMPDSNREIRLSLNSSAFGRGEYRIRIQGYTWRGERVDAGWVRLVVR